MDALGSLRSRPHISISQLRVFLGCPRRHRFQYIDRIPADFRPIALVFGTAWHGAMDDYLLRGSSTAEVAGVFRDLLTRNVQEGDLPVLFEDDERLGDCVDIGTRMVDSFIGRVPRPDQVLGVEVAFSIELVDPTTGEVLGAPLIGSIDALVVDNDRPAVWELKSGKRRWTEDMLEFDMQMTAYRMGARVHSVEDPALKVLVTTKARCPSVQVETVVRTDRDERELALVAVSIMRALDAGVDHPLRGWQCRSCPYAGRCG